MDIRQQNETVLSHPAVRKKENTVVNRERGRVLLQKVYIQAAALSALSKAVPTGIGTRAATRADMSTLAVNRNQAKSLSAMDNKIDYDSILTK